MTHSGSWLEDHGWLAFGSRVKGDDGVLGQGDPVVEVGVVGLVDADATAGHVGDDGGDGHAFHDVAAVEVVALVALEEVRGGRPGGSASGGGRGC